MNSKIRKILAGIFFVGITLLFLDFTGTIHAWFGWMAKIQFLPAVLALNLGVVIALILLTLLMGRIYCSVICPLGVLQDIFGWIGKKHRKNRYSYSKPMNVLRYVMLGFLVVTLVGGLGSVAALIAPYSAFGRIASNLFAPIYLWGNNLLASWAESVNSYAFYSVDVWLKGGVTLMVAIVTLAALFVLAYKNGRTYCNTICPVGTVLGFLSRFSYLKPVIDTSKCNGCGLCMNVCPFSAIDLYRIRRDWIANFDVPSGMTIDDVIEKELREGMYGRCVYQCDNDVVDHQIVSMEMESEVTISFSMDVFTLKDNRETHISLTEGEIDGDETCLRVRHFRGAEETVYDFSDLVHQPFHAGSDLAIVADFIDAIRTGRQDLTTSIECSIESHRICFEAERSRKEQRTILF